MTVQQPDIQWFIARDGKQHGPLSDVEMRTFVAQGHLRPTDLIWRAGFADWRPAPAVFPFQSPEPPRPPPYAAVTGPPRNGGYAPEHSFEPSRIRVARGWGEDGPSWPSLVVAGSVLLVLLAAGAGWFVWQKANSLRTDRHDAADAGLSPVAEMAAPTARNPIELGAQAPSTAPPIEITTAQEPERPLMELVARTAQELDVKFQQTAMWSVVKREFPDWYSEQLREAAQLTAQNQPQIAIAKHLAQALVELRRKHAEQALAASTEKLKVVASAFLNNLKTLSGRGIGACYGFISQGETSPAVLELMLSPQEGQTVQAQVTAIFEAIADGRKTPKAHERAIKSDYEVLVQQLTKLGWKENDLKVFSNPTALSREPPARVCQMVQDWFVAHLSVQDKAAQERLLVETLKPVVSG